MRSTEDIEQTMKRHADTVWRVCALYFRSEADRQDAFQETFLRYAQAEDVDFSDDEHRKAWLIRVARTRCLDAIKAADRTRVVSGDDALAAGEARNTASAFPTSSVTPSPFDQPGSFASEVMDAMRALTDPPRTPLYLSICEELTAPEIAELINAPVNTVYSWISRGKHLLREALS